MLTEHVQVCGHQNDRKCKYLLEIFSKLEIISSFTNKIARWLKVILSAGMLIILMLGTLNPLSNVSVVSKDSRSEVMLNQQNKIKGNDMWKHIVHVLTH